MKPHRFDVLSFIFGLAFVALAGGVTFTHFNMNSTAISWAGAGLLIIAGLAMVLGSRNRDRQPVALPEKDEAA